MSIYRPHPERNLDLEYPSAPEGHVPHCDTCAEFLEPNGETGEDFKYICINPDCEDSRNYEEPEDESEYNIDNVRPRPWRIKFETKGSQIYGLTIYAADGEIDLEIRGSDIYHDKDWWLHIIHCVNAHDKLAPALQNDIRKMQKQHNGFRNEIAKIRGNYPLKERLRGQMWGLLRGIKRIKKTLQGD